MEDLKSPGGPAEDTRDLGFGSRVAREARFRLLNRDGTFNVRRRGLSALESLTLYQTLITAPWWVFHCTIVGLFLVFNALFALGYLLCGPDALYGIEGHTAARRFLETFFFSVQTSTTIGYGHLAPANLAANLLSSAEVMVGLLGFALTTSMLFARVSRPSANIAYSRHAIMAPYREGRGLMFRIANRRGNELIEVNVTVTLSLVEGEGASRRRRFYQLPLERTTVTFFPLSWTVVHPVDPRSPLHGLGREELLAADGELLVLLTATDETFSQSVHSRSSYKGEEIVWGARFRDMFHTSPDGRISVDLQHIHDIEPAPLP